MLTLFIYWVVQFTVLYTFWEICLSNCKYSYMLLAILSAELVFNGELIIDRDFSTNDPYILAAGPGTRYKSCYYADDYRHKYYNSSEVGREVSETITLISI